MRKIPINKPSFGKEEFNALKKVLEEGNLTNASFEGGKRVQELESRLSNYVGTKYAAAVNSGTSAIYAALLALGIGRGDEVLLPSFTFLATANAVVATGATPTFIDIKRNDYTMDPKDFEEKITPNSKAVIPVHLYGHVADMQQTLEISRKNSLYIIEDACQSLGSSIKGRQTGSFGDIGCFSFYASKVITSGEGGAITANNKELADKIRMIRNHGMLEGYDTRILGLNLRMMETTAAILNVQMKKLDKILRMRRKNAHELTELLDGHGIDLPREKDRLKYNWYLYTIATDKRDFLNKKLNSIGIGATVYYDPPIHKTPFYSIYGVSVPNTEWAAEHVLSLPVHPLMNAADIRTMAKTISG